MNPRKQGRASLFVDSPNLERSLLNGPEGNHQGGGGLFGFVLIVAAHIELSIS